MIGRGTAYQFRFWIGGDDGHWSLWLTYDTAAECDAAVIRHSDLGSKTETRPIYFEVEII